MNTSEVKRVLETALICTAGPLPLATMKSLFDGEVGSDTLRVLLDELAREWADRGVELVALAGGWRFQSRPEMRPWLDRLHPEKPPKYSRAALETLAIVAYRQPVTRGDIEDIRGVTVSSHIVKQLEDRGWIETIGYREAPGRPALYATTRQFLDDLGLASLDQLPPLEGRGDGEPGAQALAALDGAAPLLGDAQATLPLEAGTAPEVPDATPLPGETAPPGAAAAQGGGEPSEPAADASSDRPVHADAAGRWAAGASSGSPSGSSTGTCANQVAAAPAAAPRPPAAISPSDASA